MNIQLKNSGVVFEIERFAVNDGPGIRSVVFLKGCPLHCKWCANPESQSSEAQLMYWKSRCLGCRRCVASCPQGALSWNGKQIVIDRDKCDVCGWCTDVCNSNALTAVGRKMTVDEVLDVVDRDQAFYQQSGGGVTFSGGEVFHQIGFLKALAVACKSKGIHTAVESSCFTSRENLDDIKDVIDLFMIDFKSMDDHVHQKFIGQSNQQILKNFKFLAESGQHLVARAPVIPGVNDSMGHFSAMADFLEEFNPGCRVDLLPYHQLGVSKYDRLDMPYDLRETVPPDQKQLETYKVYFESRGFQATIGG